MFPDHNGLSPELNEIQKRFDEIGAASIRMQQEAIEWKAKAAVLERQLEEVRREYRHEILSNAALRGAITKLKKNDVSTRRKRLSRRKAKRKAIS